MMTTCSATSDDKVLTVSTFFYIKDWNTDRVSDQHIEDETKWLPDNISKCIFLNSLKLFNFKLNFIEISSLDYNWQ